MTNSTPDTDDALRIDQDTKPLDIRRFVERRVKDPLEFENGGIVIWNFSTHEPKEELLADKAPTLRNDYYVIPYQVPGAWGYMQDLLPEQVRNAELLVYSIKDDRYKAFPNFRRASRKGANIIFQGDMETWLDKQGYI